MKILKDSRNSIVWNIVAVFAMMGIITFASLYIQDIKGILDDVPTAEIGPWVFMFWTAIISASITLVYNILRILYKVSKSTDRNNTN